MKGSQDRSPSQEPNVKEATEGCRFLVHSLLSLFLYAVQDHLTRGGPTHSGDPTTFIIKKMSPKACL